MPKKIQIASALESADTMTNPTTATNHHHRSSTPQQISDANTTITVDTLANNVATSSSNSLTFNKKVTKIILFRIIFGLTTIWNRLNDLLVPLLKYTKKRALLKTLVV